MGLFEELCEVYPLENVHPYGAVLIVPHSAFKGEWKPVLEAEGVQIFTNAYDGKVCFFLRKKGGEVKSEPQPVQFEAKPKPRRLEWTTQDLELLKRLRAEGVGLEEIARRLNRPKGSILGKLRALKSEGGLNACHAQPKLEAESRGGNEALFTEFLSAAQALYPKFKHATALLLKEAARILEGLGE